jgi:hypothetical protein
MSGARPSVFGQEDDLDLSRFEPKREPEAAAVSPETVRRVSEEAGFPSRAQKPYVADQLLRRPTVPKTGRTVLLNARVTQRAHDRFHELIERERLRYEAGELTHRVTLGEIVERALAALEREMGTGGGIT